MKGTTKVLQALEPAYRVIAIGVQSIQFKAGQAGQRIIEGRQRQRLRLSPLEHLKLITFRGGGANLKIQYRCHDGVLLGVSGNSCR